MQNTTFEKVIGLEVHVQLATKSKAFSRDAVIFGAEPNTAVSTFSLAHPGTLPIANAAHLESAIKLGLAIGGRINKRSTFDRKNYFYADSPKGYQITQDKHSIVVGGHIQLKNSEIRIHHIHMEDDAGKSLHDQHDTLSLVDLNRAGTPLLEIVTEPDFRNGDEVTEFMEYMRKLVRWLDISDGNMEEGSLRCDVNISLRPIGQEAYGTRCEIKNMNSMRFARMAIAYEEKRQAKRLLEGDTITQQTRGFDPSNGTTYELRDKEDAHDYRYFPDPDLPPMHVTHEQIEEIRSSLPPLPHFVFQTLTQTYQITAPDADILVSDRGCATYTLALLEDAPEVHHKPIAQLMIQKIKPLIEAQNIDYQQFALKKVQIIAFLDAIENGKVSHSAAYQKLFAALLEQPHVQPLGLAEKLGILQANDGTLLRQQAEKVLAANPEKVLEYKRGKKGLMGMFMGELMKEAKGKADPKEATKILAELLSI
jgi:aspartyl-tRNA(Asn)/glutamyl-tRNA(Gln) amidotransferase subunit B